MKNDKVQRRKEAAEAALSKGISALALAIFQGRQTQSPISGHHNQYHPQLQAQHPRSHWLQREVSEEQVVTLSTPKHPHTDHGEPLPPNLSSSVNTSVNNAPEVHTGESNTNGGKFKVYQQTSTASMSEGGCWVKIK